MLGFVASERGIIQPYGGQGDHFFCFYNDKGVPGTMFPSPALTGPLARGQVVNFEDGGDFSAINITPVAGRIEKDTPFLVMTHD